MSKKFLTILSLFVVATSFTFAEECEGACEVEQTEAAETCENEVQAESQE